MRPLTAERKTAGLLQMPAVSNKGRTNTKVLKEDKKKNPFKVSHRTAKPKPIIVKKNEVKSTPQANITEFVPKPNTLLWMKMLDPRDKTDRDAVFERIYSLSLSGVTNRLSWMFCPFSSKTRPPIRKTPERSDLKMSKQCWPSPCIHRKKLQYGDIHRADQQIGIIKTVLELKFDIMGNR